MKKVILFIVVTFLFFTGCSKEELPEYDLVLCDTSMSQMSEYLSDFSTENFVVKDIDFGNDQLSEFLVSLEENIEYITSVSVYSKNINEEIALLLIDFVKKENIPVIFAFSDISTDILITYDKAFCITTDYLHAGEITAVKLKQLWSEGVIADTNGDQLFAFSTVKSETETQELEDFFNTLISGIELYGIPMQNNGIVSPDEITDAEQLEMLKSQNEGIIVISENVFPAVSEYSSENEAVEIITIQQGIENTLSGATYTLNCFVDYRNYKLAADEILRNYNNRQYPLIESSFPVKDRTVFIPATI